MIRVKNLAWHRAGVCLSPNAMAGITAIMASMLMGPVCADPINNSETRRVRVVIPTAESRRAGYTGRFRIIYSQDKPALVGHRDYRKWHKTVTRIARQQRIEPALLHAVINAESSYDPHAVSEDGAIGLMQLMPATATLLGVEDPFDPIANITGGSRFLRRLLNQFKRLDLALAAYNAGANAVRRYGNRIPPYPETQRYVSKVLAYYDYFKQIYGATNG